MAVQRYRLAVRYDGTDFAGSQEQPAKRRGDGSLLPPPRTVSGTLKTELEKILPGQIKLLWAGRTDSGVHARENFCAFDAHLPMQAADFLALLSSRLPNDVWPTSIDEVALDWHPRYAARSREYLYRLYREAELPYDLARYIWHLDDGLDMTRMQTVLLLLCGTHDMAGFTKRAAPGGTICRVAGATLVEIGAELHFRVVADRFVWRMVRNLVAAIVEVGRGRMTVDEFQRVLSAETKLRFRAAPARGLVLEKVNYA